MGTRRMAREWAVQLLFQLDLNPCEDLAKVFDAFCPSPLATWTWNSKVPGWAVPLSWPVPASIESQPGAPERDQVFTPFPPVAATEAVSTTVATCP